VAEVSPVTSWIHEAAPLMTIRSIQCQSKWGVFDSLFVQTIIWLEEDAEACLLHGLMGRNMITEKFISHEARRSEVNSPRPKNEKNERPETDRH
jgi:hypothetical protein